MHDSVLLELPEPSLSLLHVLTFVLVMLVLGGSHNHHYLEFVQNQWFESSLPNEDEEVLMGEDNAHDHAYHRSSPYVLTFSMIKYKEQLSGFRFVLDMEYQRDYEWLDMNRQRNNLICIN